MKLPNVVGQFFVPVVLIIPFSGGTTVLRPPKAHELDESYTFEEYINHFEKTYPDPEEYIRRSTIFAKNLDLILSHNQGRLTESGDVTHGYVMGVNRFTDVEDHELPTGYNKMYQPEWISQLRSSRASVSERMLGSTTTSYSRPPDLKIDDVSDLPESKDWAEEGFVNPIIPQQGGCGSCWTFAAIGAIEAHLAIATGEPPVSLSEQNLLNCSPDPMHCGGDGKCSGSTPELAYNYVADVSARNISGVFNLDDLPYSSQISTCNETIDGATPSVGIEGWTKLPSNDYKSIMNALAKVGPLSIAVAAGGNFSKYEKGVMDGGDGIGDTTVDHAVLLVGYGTDEDSGEEYYKIRNSWGDSFGENGYIRIKRTADDSNLCGMDNNPLIGLSCALDENGNKVDVEPVKVCGTNAVLFDASYPVGVHHWDKFV